jgi:hypothetical protein
MNKANQRELDKAIAWLDLNDDDATEMACRTLATIQRCGTAADTKTILAIIKDRGLSHCFYTENHCLMAW